ncbi:hypothetical protein V493_00033 [Pseudogymnoascus sp. VKM F-4281 (FW-2241)]|nr:hypothetical protein V493_00033 [Pseudogymnoascus sp. VKM F-4281 (FW-2241)]
MSCNAATEFISDSMIAATMEALLGAAYYNGGLDSVAQMLSVMDLGSGLDAMLLLDRSGFGKSVAKSELWFSFEGEPSHAQQGFIGFRLAALATMGEQNGPENLTWVNA